MFEKTKFGATDKGVLITLISIQEILEQVADSHIITFSANPTENTGLYEVLSMKQSTAWVWLDEKSNQLSYFQEQIKKAFSLCSSSVSGNSKQTPSKTLFEELYYLKAHPPSEKIILVFYNYKILDKNSSQDFLRELSKHPPQNLTILLLWSPSLYNQSNLNLYQKVNLDIVLQLINTKNYDELTRFFMGMGISYQSQSIAEKYLYALKQIPDEDRKKNPIFEIIYSCMLFYSGQIEEAYYTLDALIKDKITVENSLLLGEIYLMKAYMEMGLGRKNYTKMIFLASELLPEGSSLIGTKSGMSIGNNQALLYTGSDGNGITQSLEEMYIAAPLLEKLAHGFGSGREYIASAEYHYFTGQMKKASIYVHRGMEYSNKYAQWDITCRGHDLLARIAFFQGDVKKTIFHINKMKEYHTRCTPDNQIILRLPILTESELLLKIGKIQYIEKWLLDDDNKEVLPPFQSGHALLMKAGLLACNKQYNDALIFADKAIQQYIQYRQYLPLISSFIFKSTVYAAIEEDIQSASNLQIAYEMAAPSGLVLLFFEYGKQMIYSLNTYEKTGYKSIPKDWLVLVKAKAGVYDRTISRIRNDFLIAKGYCSVLSCLTKREKEALELLSNGLTNYEIAERMGIQYNSVRTLVYRMYEKIGVSNRAEALRLSLSEKYAKASICFYEPE